MSQTVVGIDLGSYSIKICQLERSFKNFELLSFYEQVITQGTRLSREEAAVTALRLLLERHEIPLDNVGISFPAHLLSCRVLELPFTNVKKIEQTIEFELESFIPLPLEDLVVDYHILSIGEEKSTVLASYVPRARLVKYLDLLQSVGIDPRFVGVDAIDLSHIAQVAMVPQDDIYAVVDIGHEKTNICIMEGIKLKYVRSVTVGGVHFTRAIQKAFNLNFERAEGLKLDRGKVSFVEEELDQLSRILKKVADELIVFLQQTAMGFKQLYSERAWHGIYLCGGGSRLPGLADMISATMRMNVSSLDCLDFVNNHLEHPDEVRDLVPTSLAQTIKVIFSNKAVKINFRRGEFAYQRDIKALGGEIKQVAAWMVVVFLLGLGNFLFSYTSTQSQGKKLEESTINAVVKEFPDLKTVAKGGTKKLLTALTARLTEIKTQTDAFNTGSQGSVLDLLQQISEKLPLNSEVPIDVDDFSFTGESIRIEGRTVSYEAVDKIKNSLIQSGYFKNVTTQNIVKGVKDEIKFSLSIDLSSAANSEDNVVKAKERS